MGLFRDSPLGQSFRIPAPPVTEKNCPDQKGRVHIVTGGYGGVGLELCKILYQHNARVYIAGRSKAKYTTAASAIQSAYPDSQGALDFLLMDFSNLATIKPAVEEFKTKESALHVLTLNAGVMQPPSGSKDAHGHELQLGTNCLGSYLTYQLLRPVLVATATGSVSGNPAPKGSVRVSWAGSIVIDLLSPRPGGMVLEADGSPKVYGFQQSNYGSSKAGNLFLASVMAGKDKADGVLHSCFNPGNLKTDLARHYSAFERFFLGAILHPAVYGAYTELYSAVGNGIDESTSGCYVAPWGRVWHVRKDVQQSLSDGKAESFIGWCERETKDFS